MNDPEIRKLFFEKNGYVNTSERQKTRCGGVGISGLQPSGEYVFQEFGIMEGHVVADVVVIDLRVHSGVGGIAGFEIKSNEDNFKRFDRQQKAYSNVFDENCLIVGESHMHHSLDICPEKWTIMVARENGLDKIRYARTGSPCPSEFVKLLWRAEAYDILKRHGLGLRMSGACRQAMWDRLVESVEWPVLKSEILKKITERRGWK